MPKAKVLSFSQITSVNTIFFYLNNTKKLLTSLFEATTLRPNAFCFPRVLSSLHKVDGVKDVSSCYPHIEAAAVGGLIKWLDGDGNCGMVAQYTEPIACERVEVILLPSGIVDGLAVSQNP